jgi:hypothetical protein
MAASVGGESLGVLARRKPANRDSTQKGEVQTDAEDSRQPDLEDI